MTTKLLNQAKNILNSHNAFPQGIDLDTRLKLVAIDASQYEYWNHKYSEGEECFINRAVALCFQHSMVEKPFWIVFFHGAQHRKEEDIFVAAYWEKPCMRDAIYEHNGIEIGENDKEDGVETIMDIVNKFNLHWFSEDNSEMNTPIIDDNPRAVCDLAEDLVGLLCIDINLSVPLEHVTIDTIVALENELQRAKEAWRATESKKILDGILLDEKAPELLKALLVKNNITSFEWEKFITSADYMPDACQLLDFSSNDEFVFTLVFDLDLSTEEAIDFGLIESGHLTKENFVESVKETQVLEDGFEENLKQEEINEVFDYLYELFMVSNTIDGMLRN